MSSFQRVVCTGFWDLNIREVSSIHTYSCTTRWALSHSSPSRLTSLHPSHLVPHSSMYKCQRDSSMVTRVVGRHCIISLQPHMSTRNERTPETIFICSWHDFSFLYWQNITSSLVPSPYTRGEGLVHTACTCTRSPCRKMWGTIYITVMCYHGDPENVQTVCTRPSPLV